MAHRWVRSLFGLVLVAVVFVARQFFVSVVAPARYADVEIAHTGWWLAFAGILAASAYGLGLPEMPKSRMEAFARGVGAVLATSMVVSLAQLVSVQVLLPRSSLGAVAVLVPLWSVLAWNLARDTIRWSEERDRVLVVSKSNDDASALRAELVDDAESAAVIVGSLRLDECRIGDDETRPLIEAAARLDANVIVMDRHAQDIDDIVDQVAELHRNGARVRTLALFYEGWLGKLPISELAQVSLFFDIGEVHRTRYVRVKRVFDIAIGLIGLVGFAALLPVVLVGNAVSNRGPLFFRQERVGKDGLPFEILKFRTMTSVPAQVRSIDGSDVDGPSVWTSADDQRVTRFGGLLRRSHLDELPQVLNILRGDLSVVGPRPEQVAYVEELTTKIPFYDARHIVRPGLTGWAQVKFRYGSSEADAMEKLQYDFYYLRRQGLVFDARIVVRTFREVLGALGR